MDYINLSKEELIEILININGNNKFLYDTNKKARENQEYRLYNSCKGNAKRKNIEFNIEIGDIIIPECCPIFGWKLTNISGEGRVKTNASIDRVDSSKGYIKGNIVIMSDLANRMKQNATEEELVLFAEGILNHYVNRRFNKKT